MIAITLILTFVALLVATVQAWRARSSLIGALRNDGWSAEAPTTQRTLRGTLDGKPFEVTVDLSKPLVLRTEYGRLAAADDGGPKVIDLTVQEDDDVLLTPLDVARMFRVDPKTVTRWARTGKISAIRRVGAHRKFLASEVDEYASQAETEAEHRH